MEIQTQETRIILIIKTIRLSKKINQYSIAKIYKVLYTIFTTRITGQNYYPETKTNYYKLEDIEEETII